MARIRQDERARARVRARLRDLPAARAVFDVCVDGFAALDPLAVVALGSLAGGRRPDSWSDLDLGIVLPDRRRLATIRRRVPVVVAAAGDLLAAADGPGAAQWIGLVARDDVLVKVDVHVATLAQLDRPPRFVVIHGAVRSRRRPAGRAQDPGTDARAVSFAFAAFARTHRGDHLEAALLLDRAREALVPFIRQAAGARPGGVRGLEAALPPSLRRRLRATWPQRPAAAEVRASVRALARLGIACGAAPDAFAALLRATAAPARCRAR